jgi:hypothetical protein
MTQVIDQTDATRAESRSMKTEPPARRPVPSGSRRLLLDGLHFLRGVDAAYDHVLHILAGRLQRLDRAGGAFVVVGDDAIERRVGRQPDARADVQSA